jgi:hypothetical protein
MSDFLSNLAARTIAAPSLRPRTRMRFEPEPSEEMGAPQVLDAPRVPAAAKAEAPAAEPSRPVVAREANVPVQRVEPPPATERVVERTTAAPPAPPREHVVERVVPRAGETVVVERVHETTIETTAPQTVERAVARDEPSAPRRHRYDEQPPRVDESVPTKTDRHEASPRERVITRRETNRQRIEKQLESRVTEPAPNAEPVVHVTIGRVEVRAVTQPAPQRPAAQRSPVMTIDDYVAKRSSKERR